MSTTPKIHKVIIALGLAKLSTSQLIANTKLYVQKMTGNPDFTTPTPTLEAVTTQLAALEASYTLAQTRAHGAAAAMRADRKSHSLLLKSLAGYVEGVANANPPQAETIAGSSGMPLKKNASRTSPNFTVTLTKVPGEVQLKVKAVKKAGYIFDMTTDPTLATGWNNILYTQESKNLKSGLNSGTRYYFRYATSIKGVQGPWSAVMNVIMP
ncbi:MAG TPA: hypothetical protein VNZ86_03015 [Bacteroidia bacterium]|jgi:hypothetical protein|nr:hypothetical protein [Bacteroidia bacterium]